MVKTIFDYNSEYYDINIPSDLCASLFNFMYPPTCKYFFDDQIPEGFTICIDDDIDLTVIHLNIIQVFYNGNRLKCEKLINKITPEAWNYYCFKTIPILNEYVKIMIPFCKNRGENYVPLENDTNFEKRLKLIIEYINVVKELDIVYFNNYFKFTASINCPKCNNFIEDSAFSNDGNTYCKCGNMLNNIEKTDDFIEIEKGIIPKAQVNLLLPINKWLNEYTGTEKLKISNEELNNLFNFFDEEINKLWPSLLNNKSRIGRNEITILISRSKNSNLHKNYRLIRHLYTGWPLPFLTEEEKERIRNDYVLIQTNLKDGHNINIEIQGYLHLRNIDKKVYAQDFKMPNDKEIIMKALDKWTVLCKGTHLKTFKIE